MILGILHFFRNLSRNLNKVHAQTNNQKHNKSKKGIKIILFTYPYIPALSTMKIFVDLNRRCREDQT